MSAPSSTSSARAEEAHRPIWAEQPGCHAQGPCAGAQSIGSAGAGSRRLLRGGGATRRTLRAGRLSGRGRPLRTGAAMSARPGLPRQCPRRRGGTAFPLERGADGARSLRRRLRPGASSSSRQIRRGALAGLLRCRSLLGWWKLHARPSRLGQPDRDRLLCRSRAVLSLANVVYLLANELTRLGRRGFPLALVSFSALDRLLLRHAVLLQSLCAD
jgi:hypothetical protein